MVRSGCVLALALGVSSAVSGCSSSTCDGRETGEDPIAFKGGNTDGGQTTYQSSGWKGPFLLFPPGRRYDFVHRLGRVPETVNVYLSFSESGIEGGNVSAGVGNQALIEEVDDEKVRVFNDTCSESFVRVTASTSALEPEAGTLPPGSVSTP